MKLLEKYSSNTVTDNELRLVLCRIEEFIFEVSKNIADKDYTFSYKRFSDDELGSIYTFLMDEDIPYFEDKLRDEITITVDSVWEEILKRKALTNPSRLKILRLSQEHGTCDQYEEVIGIINFGQDKHTERSQFQMILTNHKKLKDLTFNHYDLLEKGYTQAEESRFTVLLINDYDFYDLGDKD